MAKSKKDKTTNKIEEKKVVDHVLEEKQEEIIQMVENNNQFVLLANAKIFGNNFKKGDTFTMNKCDFLDELVQKNILKAIS